MNIAKNDGVDVIGKRADSYFELGSLFCSCLFVHVMYCWVDIDIFSHDMLVIQLPQGWNLALCVLGVV
jgi:hypothetical protein